MPSPPRIHCWELSPECGLDELRHRLAPAWKIRSSQVRTGAWQVVDDFDWTLWAHQTALVVGADEARLLPGDLAPLVAKLPAMPDLPLRPEDLPDCPLRAALLRCTERPLLPRGEFVCHHQDITVANASGKTVARGRQEDWSLPDGTALSQGLSLAPLRGYRDEFALLLAALGTTPLRPLPSPPLLAILATGAQERFLPEVPELDLHLQEDLPPWAAVRDLVANLLANTWRNEAGVLTDLDPECLHHYRVNLRRARALVSQTGSVIGKRTARHLADHLGAIARSTGALRDLDVQLANRAWYESLVPDHQVPQLAGFMTDLEHRRRNALRTLRRRLRSRAHQHHRERLAELLAGITARHRPQPLAELLLACVRRRFQRLTRHVRHLGEHPSDTDLHRLRIDAKKLRYPFESARSIFPAELTANWVPQLKHVQDALGAAHDLVICLGWVNGRIAAVATSRDPEPTEALELLAAALRDQLQTARETARRKVGEFVGQHTDDELHIAGKRRP